MRLDYISIKRGLGRTLFYVNGFCRYVVPNSLYRYKYMFKQKRLTDEERAVMDMRVNYYNRLRDDDSIDNLCTTRVGDFTYPFRKKHKFSAYFLDLYESVRCFDPKLKFHYIFGDVDYETSYPTFVKSRPIVSSYTKSVVCKLNKFRHFRFVNDAKPFNDKKDMIVFRNIVRKQPQRTRFLELFVNHPMCNVGQINEDGNPDFVKPYMCIDEMLEYKFIACIEGHDVATNLKWVMSSNSLAVMPKPKIESWFMEGTLVGGYHYVEVKDDYSDLIEKMKYYIEHRQEAETIIQHAHEYVAQFCNKRLEECIQYKVVERYFERTGQLNQIQKQNDYYKQF